MNFRLTVAGQDDGIMALQRHPPIIALHVCPQWISAYDLLEDAGFLAVQKISWHVRVKEKVPVVIMAQFKFIPEKLIADYPNVLPANHFAQDFQQGTFTPTSIPR